MLKRQVKNIRKFIRPQEILSIVYIQLVYYYIRQFSYIQIVAAIISIVQAFKVGIDFKRQLILKDIIVTLVIVLTTWIIVKVLVLLLIKSSKLRQRVLFVLKTAACIVVQIDLVTSVQFMQDIANLIHQNKIYAEYLEPYQQSSKTESLTAKHNLIVIYMESLENTGQLKKYGGYIPDNEENLLENLTAIANNEYASL